MLCRFGQTSSDQLNACPHSLPSDLIFCMNLERVLQKTWVTSAEGAPERSRSYRMKNTELWTTRCLIFRLSAVFILLQYSPCIYAGGSCQENIYLEVGKQGLVPCNFENFDIIGWINGDGDVTNTSPFIYLEDSQIYGRGYRSGDYDMHSNGSLIINDVKLKNEFNYTVLFVPHPAGANEYFKVPVKVYVPPEPGYPVVNGRTNQVVIHVNTSGFINCSLTGIRPRVHLAWVASPDEISLKSSHRVTNNSDGTYNTYLTSSYKVINSPTGRVSFKCRVAGQLAELFPSVTTAYLLLEKRFPVVNGLANQQHVVLHVNREGELTFSMDKVSQDVALELVTIFPDSSDEILLDNENNFTTKGDDTVNITLTSRFRVLRRSIRHFTLKCRVTGQAADEYPDATTVELLVTETTDQECESLLNSQLRFLVVNVIIFWLIVFWIKLGKDFARKLYWVVTQSVNNKDNIEAGCSQCSHCREMRTKLLNLLKNCETFADSGVSSSPCSSTASRDPRDIEGRNAHDNEAFE